MKVITAPFPHPDVAAEAELDDQLRPLLNLLERSGLIPEEYVSRALRLAYAIGLANGRWGWGDVPYRTMQIARTLTEGDPPAGWQEPHDAK